MSENDLFIEDWEILELLTRLVDKSLALYEPETGRYRLLESVRQYSHEKLSQINSDADRFHRQHLGYFLQRAEEAKPQLRGPKQAQWLDALEAEHDNLREALHYSFDSRLSTPDSRESGLRLAVALGMFWIVRGYVGEGHAHYTTALASPAVQADPPRRAEALSGVGVMADRLGDFEAARRALEECLAIRREIGPPRSVAAALFNLGQVEFAQANYAPARAYSEESLALFRESGDKHGCSLALNTLGSIHYEQGGLEAARATYREMLSLDREIGDTYGIGIALNNLGLVAAEQGDSKAARAYHEESLALKREIGSSHGIAQSLHQLGHLAANEGDLETARALQEESLAIRQALGDKHDTANSFGSLGEIAIGRGDVAEARRCYGECLRLHDEIGNKYGTAIGLDNCAQLAAAEKRWERAARLFAAMEAQREAIGSPLSARARADVDNHLADIRAAIGDEAFEAASAAGRAWSLEQAVRYALWMEAS